jgi:hypothetical protein
MGRGRAARGGGQTPQQRQQKSRAAAAVRSGAPAAGGGARAALRAVTAGAAGGLARGDVAVASPMEMPASVVADAVASPAEETPAEMSLAAVYSSPAHKLWKDKDTCRMIIAACSEPLRKFLEKLGTQPDRLESECSSTSNPQRPDDQFFTALEAQFNDPQFQATLPWSDAHLSSKKNDPAHFPLSGRRDATYLRKQWATAAAKFETAHNRYTQSGVNDECFCLCGATGFYTFSGWTVAFAQEERVNEPLSGNKAWHPKAVLSVYLWSLARNNCDVFGKKSSKVLPHGVRMTGRVVGLPSTSGGGAGGGGGVGGGGGDGGKKRRREKQVPHDQSDAIFKDDGEERVSRKQDIMGEVLELLKKNEEAGGRTRAMGLQALVSQQSTMTNTITSLLQQARLLKEELRQADDPAEVQDLEDEIQDVIQSRRAMWQRLMDLDEEISKETNVVARERNLVVERAEQEQMSRRARDANAARVLQLNSPSPSCSGGGEGQGAREGDGMVEEGGDEEGGD